MRQMKNKSEIYAEKCQVNEKGFFFKFFLSAESGSKYSCGRSEGSLCNPLRDEGSYYVT